MKDTKALVDQAHSFLNQKGEIMPNTGGWQIRHKMAWHNPRDAVGGLRDMIVGWGMHADQHLFRTRPRDLLPLTGDAGARVLSSQVLELGAARRSVDLSCSS